MGGIEARVTRLLNGRNARQRAQSNVAACTRLVFHGDRDAQVFSQFLGNDAGTGVCRPTGDETDHHADGLIKRKFLR